MSTLAINGGSSVKTGGWPTWPIRGERERELLLEVLAGQWSYDGPKDLECGQRFAEFSGARFGRLVANGTVALQLALEALDVGYGDEVIVPGLTWQATASACLDVNAAAVLVDIDPDTYCVDPAAVEAAITDRTRAIMAVHLYGRMADMDALLALAAKHGLHIVEDCAHQHGSRWRDRGAGSLGAVGAFSMQESKVMTSGEGGAVLTSDEALAERLYALRNCGRELRAGAQTRHSGNYRVTEWQAAVLLAQLERLEEQTEHRAVMGRRLDEGLAQIPGVRPMGAQPQVTRQAYYCYTFRLDPEGFAGASVQQVREAIGAELGLGIGGTYEPLNRSPLYQPLTKRRHHLGAEYEARINPTQFVLPNCDRAFAEAAALAQPVLLAPAGDIDAIIEAVAKVQKHAAELARPG